MPNRNYTRGRAREYRVMTIYRDCGYRVIRASGSHGEFDLIAYLPSAKPAFIQCKLVGRMSEMKRLEAGFRKRTKPTEYYHQILNMYHPKTHTEVEVIV